MIAKSTLRKYLDRLRTDHGSIATKWWWLGVVVGGLIFVTILGGVFWTIVAVIGLLGCIVGTIAIAHGSAKMFHLSSRSSGGAVLAVGVVVLLLGTAANAATHPSAAITASISTGGSVSLEQETTPSPTPVETESELQEVTPIPFGLATVDDSNSDIGTTTVTTAGQNGETTTTYLVKFVDGVEISRAVSREEVTIPPIAQVTSIGSRQPAPPAPAPPSNCDPNYADVCVPIASDVDCAGGSGNGPAYVDGPLRIVGTDVYDLDRDGDGVACDK